METPVITILSISMDLSSDEFSRIQIPQVHNVLPAGIQSNHVDRVVGTVSPGPTITFEFIVLRDGTTINLTEDFAPKDEV
jgi:hypothetical protein